MLGGAVFSFNVWGSVATVATTDAELLIPAVNEIRHELDNVDRTCNRFRTDSDISRLNDRAGSWLVVDPLLVEATEVAVRAARLTDGLVDPTVGDVMRRIGYDRDFSQIEPTSPDALPEPEPAPGWQLVEVREDASSIRIPSGTSLDLGATAKALAADRGAERAAAFIGCGVVLSLGGDIATAGLAPEDGWTVGIADDHRAEPEPGETVSIENGGIATSSTTVRRWKRAGVPVHHIVDPRTGDPAREVWRTVSVAAANCVDANVASTAAIVMGESAPAWLQSRDLPARLVPVRISEDAPIVRVGAWPDRLAA